MNRAGKVLSWIGIIAFLLAFTQRYDTLRSVVARADWGPLALGIVGALGAIAVFASWGMAFYHWGTRFPGDRASKRRWGIALLLGMFVAGWAYWLMRIRRSGAQPVEQPGTG